MQAHIKPDLNCEPESIKSDFLLHHFVGKLYTKPCENMYLQFFFLLLLVPCYSNCPLS